MKDWIDCKDKLPNVDGDYIVSINCVDCTVFILSYSCYSKTWYDDYSFQTLGVTHWMPLPEPPKTRTI